MSNSGKLFIVLAIATVMAIGTTSCAPRTQEPTGVPAPTANETQMQTETQTQSTTQEQGAGNATQEQQQQPVQQTQQ